MTYKCRYRGSARAWVETNRSEPVRRSVADWKGISHASERTVLIDDYLHVRVDGMRRGRRSGLGQERREGQAGENGGR